MSSRSQPHRLKQASVVSSSLSNGRARRLECTIQLRKQHRDDQIATKRAQLVIAKVGMNNNLSSSSSSSEQDECSDENVKNWCQQLVNACESGSLHMTTIQNTLDELRHVHNMDQVRQFIFPILPILVRLLRFVTEQYVSGAFTTTTVNLTTDTSTATVTDYMVCNLLWILSTTLSGTHEETWVVMRMGVLEPILAVWTDPSFRLNQKSLALWCIANMIAEMDIRAHMFQQGILHTLLETFSRYGDGTTLRQLVSREGGLDFLTQLTFVCQNMCRGPTKSASASSTTACSDMESTVQDALPWKLIQTPLPLLTRILAIVEVEQSAEIVSNILWTFVYMTQHETADGSETQRFDAMLATPSLFPVLQHTCHAILTVKDVKGANGANNMASVAPNVVILKPMLRIVGNLISSSDPKFTDEFLAAGFLPDIVACTDAMFSIEIRKIACWILSNISAGTPSQNQHIRTPVILNRLCQMATLEHHTIRKEALYALGNLFHENTHDAFVHQVVGTCPQIITTLCQAISGTEFLNDPIANILLDSLLVLVQKGPDGTHQRMEEADLFSHLEQLQCDNKFEHLDLQVTRILAHLNGETDMLDGEYEGDDTELLNLTEMD